MFRTGITCLVRSRTWMIQLQSCKNILFDNIKMIGGTRLQPVPDSAWRCPGTGLRDVRHGAGQSVLL